MTQPEQPCGITQDPHPTHKFMRGRKVYQCPGGPAPAEGEQDLVAQLAAAIRANSSRVDDIELAAALLPVVRAAETAAVRRALEDAADDAVCFKGAWPIVAAWLRDRAAAVAAPAREEQA